MPDPLTELAATNAALLRAVETLSDDVTRLTDAQTRLRHRALADRIVLGLVAVLAAVSGWTVFQVNDEQRANCEAGNDARAAVVAAVEGFTEALLGASEQVERTPAEQAAFEERSAAFRADIDRRLEPLEARDC